MKMQMTIGHAVESEIVGIPQKI